MTKIRTIRPDMKITDTPPSIELEDVQNATGYVIGLIYPVLEEEITRMLQDGYTVEQIKLEMRKDYSRYFCVEI